MHTITLQIDRTGTSNNHELSPEIKYVVSCQSLPGIDLNIDCDQASFNQHKEMLRYDSKDEARRQTGITFFQQLVTKLLDDIQPLAIEASKYAGQWLHLRFLTNEKELVQLPFELALTPKNLQGQQLKPLLLNPQQLTTLTREVKQIDPPSYTWPHTPRILFAWADPGESVPGDEHFNALRDVVKELVCPLQNNPEPIPDIAQIITVLKNASLKSINDVIKKGIDNDKPFTHIHLLAHGSKDPEDKIDNYKLVLHHDDDVNEPYYATGDELARSILEIDADTIRKPAILSLMTCDSANTGSVSLPAGSLAHQLHESGIPCVFASQFPLSIPGSVKLVSALYSKLLLDGEDPRKALYYARKAIADKTIHDWASLVAHVRFPADIDEQLKDYKLKVMLGSLKTSNAWSEHLLTYRDKISPEKLKMTLENISLRLDKSINDLNHLFTQGTSKEVNKERYAEHSGLMGSAYKRKAEHLFRLAGFKPEERSSLIKQSIDALKKGRDWYCNGFTKHRQNHWTGMQYLSLYVVTSNPLIRGEKRDIWGLIRIMAEDCSAPTNDPMTQIWSWGTLIELYLLEPLISIAPSEKEVAISLTNAKSYAKKIASANSEFIAYPKIREEIEFAQGSTARQIERYISWWPEMMATSELDQLKTMAMEIKEMLKN